MGSLQPFIDARRNCKAKNLTINFGLQIVCHILNLAATEWMDEFGLTWLASAPKIKLLSLHDARQPYPLDWKNREDYFQFFQIT